jgi:hypothetical protein
VRATSGEPAGQPDPVHLERFNGVVRDRLGCLTRKTRAFAKEVEQWEALFRLTLLEHKWRRPSIAVRLRLPQPNHGRRDDQRTPAMTIGLTDHAWTWSELLMTRDKAR